jgi:hypothetical protein
MAVVVAEWQGKMGNMGKEREKFSSISPTELARQHFSYLVLPLTPHRLGMASRR